MLDLNNVGAWMARAARMMIGIPDYETYVARRRATHPGEPVMTYEEFFRQRQDARYSGLGKDRFRGCS